MLMNKSDNERFQTTEGKIIDSFIDLLTKKPLSEITVSSICRLSGIHRTSFYLHFQDVYDLMEQIERRLATYYGSLFETSEQDYDLGKNFRRLFAFIYEHQAFYLVYWNHAKDLTILDAALSNDAENHVKAVAAELGFVNEAETEYHRTFFRAGLAALIGCWLIRGCAETPEELSQILVREYSSKHYFEA